MRAIFYLDGVFGMGIDPMLTVSVWVIDHVTPCPQPALSAAEERRLASMTEPRKTEFMASRHWLRYLLAQTLRQDPRQIAITTSSSGKPIIPKHPVHFGLSHTHGRTAIAIASQPVGIDLVKVSPRPQLLTLAQRVFHPEDVHALQSIEGKARLTLFYRLWARHEAVVKAMGKGLLFPVGFPLSPHRPPLSTEGDWSIEEWALPQQWWVAVAAQTPRLQLKTHHDTPLPY
ncbi:4'-phosphopantetheinyl transferase superfamily protein [bacterium]|nr:4'-phosphopantetheinyl transferase superfamily protein [bacterium]